MARNMYGATSADFTLTSGGRVVPGATLTIWSARTGGTQITDLTDKDSVATTTVTSDADGSIVYYGPNNDKTVHWADSGVGSRIAIRPVDITGDPPVLSIGTVGTGAAAASLTGTSEAPVLNLTLPSAGANGVNTAAIQNDAVTSDKIAADAVGTSEIAAGAVGTAEIADSAVTSAKIADGTIATADIADGAVTYAKLGADVRIGNLLTLNQATGTDTLADTTGFAGTGSTIASSTAQAAQGSRSLAITATSTGAAYAIMYPSGSRLAVTASVTYTFTAQLRSDQASGETARIYPIFYAASSGGTLVSVVYSATQSITSGGWTTFAVTATVPAGAAYCELYVQRIAGANGAVTYADALGLWRGTGGVWAPPGSVVPGTSHIAANGAYTTSGTAAPEGVITAPPLSRYLQTSGAATATGAMEWVKATGTGNTGWVAGAEADTGQRDMRGVTMLNGWVTSGGDFRLQRIGNRVFVKGVLDATSATNDTCYNLPTGFRPQATSAYGTAQFGATAGASRLMEINYSTGALKFYNRGAGSHYFSASWTTPDAWPASLPGA